MDITQLRYFLKAAETMNYTRAADSLFISRQALRQSLSALERELGQSLFENDHNRLSLTQYGEYLALSCVDAVREFEALEADVDRFFHQKSPLRFAYSVSLSPYTLPGLEQFVLRDFARHFPQITLETIPCAADQLIEMVERREVDCGCVLQLPTPRPGCLVTVMRTSPVVIDSGPDSPYRDREELTLEELAQIPLIGMGRLEKIALPLWEDCKKRGLTLNYHPVPNTIDALYQVKHGLCSCLNTAPPKWSSGESRGPGRKRTILKGYTWNLALLCPQDSPNYRSAQLLCSYLIEHYEQLYEGPDWETPWDQDLVL